MSFEGDQKIKFLGFLRKKNHHLFKLKFVMTNKI